MPRNATSPPAIRSTGSVAIAAGSHEVLLLPQRALLDCASRSLMVADLHLGKAASFRAHGLPVPSGTTERTLARLDALLAQTGARRLFLLGDLLHGPEALRPAVTTALAGWRSRHAQVEVILVRGNHDARAGELPADCGIDTVAPGHRLGGLRLLHEPPVEAAAASDAAFSLSGHLHPVCVLGKRADRLRLPCFRVRGHDAVLPAFGEFTGGWQVRPDPGDRLFVTDGERVAELPQRSRPGAPGSQPSRAAVTQSRAALDR